MAVRKKVTKKKVVRKSTRKRVVKKAAKRPVRKKATKKKVSGQPVGKRAGKKAAQKNVANEKIVRKAIKKNATAKKIRRKKVAKQKTTGKKVAKKKATRKSRATLTAKRPTAKKPVPAAPETQAATPSAEQAAAAKATKTPGRIPVAANLFVETAGGPRLLGSRCVACGTPYFPKADVCHNPDCDEPRLEDASFGPYGTLWSCAVQNYPPPAPTRFDPPYKPYALGVVDMEDGLRVVSRIVADDPNSLEPNIDLELVLEPMCHDDGGNAVITWMFRPV